jgi:hypothetical protein
MDNKGAIGTKRVFQQNDDNQPQKPAKLAKTLPRAISKTDLLTDELTELLFETMCATDSGNTTVSASQLSTMLQHIIASSVGSLACSQGWKDWANVESRAGVALCDIDGDGRISKEEFKTFASKHPLLLGYYRFVA